MTTLLAILVVAVVASVIGYPLWHPSPATPTTPIGPSATLAALEDRKLQIYAGIRELGFDYRMDKLEEADYEGEVERLKAEAVGVVKQIEELRREIPRGSDELEAEIAVVRGKLDDSATASRDTNLRTSATQFCTECGAPVATDDHFCSACGNHLGLS